MLISFSTSKHSISCALQKSQYNSAPPLLLRDRQLYSRPFSARAPPAALGLPNIICSRRTRQEQAGECTQSEFREIKGCWQPLVKIFESARHQSAAAPQRACPALLVSFHSICGSLRCLADAMQVGTPPTRLLTSSLAIQRCAMLCAICDSHHSHCRNPTARLQQNCCSGTRQCVHLVQGGRPQEEALAREEVQAAGKAGVGGAIPP